MKVFIVGVAGGTGSRVARLLVDRGDQVSGLYRKPDQNRQLVDIGVSGVMGDIVQMDDRQLADAMRDCDLVVFSAGAGGGDDETMTDRIDGDGVTRSIAAAGLAGVRRFILVSVFPEAWRERHMDESFEHYIAVKKRADVELARSDLDWVILRPAALKDDPGTGTVDLGPAGFHTEITRDDVAAIIAELAHAPAVRRRILEASEGGTPIAEAVATQARD